MEETWKSIKGYEGLYEVSNMGRVRSVPHEVQSYGGRYFKTRSVIRKPHIVAGYNQVDLCKDGKKHEYKVHRLVAEAFIPHSSQLQVVNHKDENKINNNADNLEWCNAKYNTNYGTARSRRKEKLSVPVMQLTLDGRPVKKWVSQQEAARVLGIQQSSISKCVKGSYQSAHGYLWRNAI